MDVTDLLVKVANTVKGDSSAIDKLKADPSAETVSSLIGEDVSGDLMSQLSTVAEKFLGMKGFGPLELMKMAKYVDIKKLMGAIDLSDGLNVDDLKAVAQAFAGK